LLSGKIRCPDDDRFRKAERLNRPGFLFGGSMKMLGIVGWTALVASSVLAGDLSSETQVLEELVVTADRVARPVQQIASTLTVIDREDIEASGASDLAALLSMNASLDLSRSGGTGQACSLRLRGSDASHTIFLVDGVQMNDPMSPGRSVDLATFSLAFVDRVEIVYGPQSALYGADAMAGVVQIFTQKPSDFGYEVTLEAGGEGEAGAHLMLQDRMGKLGVRLECAHRRVHGFSAASEELANTEADGFEQSTFALRFDLAILPTLDFEMGLRGEISDADLDNFGGVLGDDPNNTLNTRRLGLWQDFTQRSAFGTTRLRLSIMDTRRDNHNPVDAAHPSDWLRAHYTASQKELSLHHTYELNTSNQFDFGVEWELEEGESDLRSESEWGPFITTFPEASASTQSLFMQYRLQLADLFMSSALRYDSHQSFGEARTGRFTLGLPIRQTPILFRASYGSGFKAPSLYQLHSQYANENLDPEIVHGADAGFDLRLASFTASLSFFKNETKNQIVFYTDPETWDSSYRNIKSTASQGVQASLQAQLSPELALDASIQRLSSENLETGLELIRRPRTQAQIGFTWNHAASRLRVNWRYEGSRLDLAFDPVSYAVERVRLSSFRQLDMKVEQRLSSSLHAFVSMENMLDETYEELLGYGVQARILRTGLRLTH
jgi:vitamin B12 transporter